MFRVPDWLGYEVRHKLEQLRERFERLRIRDRISEHPKIATAVAFILVLLLANGVSRILQRTPDTSFHVSKRAWFYDVNTDKLFVGSGKEPGPIAAPSGPQPNGEPAGYRANVYSYLRDPNEAECFIAFLERPDPNANVDDLYPDMNNFKEWARGRLIKRVGGTKWISPTSLRGRQIIQQVTHPDEYGHMPMYQTP